MKAATGLVLFCAGILLLLRLRYNAGVEGDAESARRKMTATNMKLLAQLQQMKLQQQELQKQLDEALDRNVQLAKSAATQVESPQRQQLTQQPRSGSAGAAAPWVPANSSIEAAHAEIQANHLLEVHRHWDWPALAKELLYPFEEINQRMLQQGVAECFDNGTMYCQRIQVVDGNLYVTDYRAIFFDRHYAPARLMLMLETMRRHKLPDLDLVVAAVDEPRIKMRFGQADWAKTLNKYPGGVRNPAKPGPLPPPLFSSTINRGHADLPWADFSFYMPRKSHKLRTPPWFQLQPKMVRESASVRWEDKIELAMHTGNTMSPFRQKVVAAAKKRPDTMLVNELFIGDHNKIKKTCHELGLERKGGYQAHKCYMTFTEQCSYKYLLNSASIGYANKFKYLLLCGSVVIYVEDGMQHKEFYEYGLLPGVHYVTVPSAKDVPRMVKYLQAHDAYARGVAAAGRARMSTLDNEAIAAFYAELFKQYAQKQTFKPSVPAGAVRLDCEDDLWRHYARDRVWMRHYLAEDNSTCIHPPAAGTPLAAPGWGGAYAGSKVRCVASHDLLPRAQPEACLPNAYQPGTSFKSFGEFPYAHEKDPQPWASLPDGNDRTP